MNAVKLQLTIMSVIALQCFAMQGIWMDIAIKGLFTFLSKMTVILSKQRIMKESVIVMKNMAEGKAAVFI